MYRVKIVFLVFTKLQPWLTYKVHLLCTNVNIAAQSECEDCNYVNAIRAVSHVIYSLMFVRLEINNSLKKYLFIGHVSGMNIFF